MLAEIYMLRLELAIRALGATYRAGNNQHISTAPGIALKVKGRWANWIGGLYYSFVTPRLVGIPANGLSFFYARRPSKEF